jgi:hypothetical protein
VILKIDFEKVYDKVKWSFLQQILRMKGFSEEWCALIYNFLLDGSVAIKVNDDVGVYFQMKICLRKGGPLSPMLTTTRHAGPGIFKCRGMPVITALMLA